MRKVFVIAFQSLLRIVRDKKALMLLLLMPMILIGILGSALKGMLEEGDIQPFTVAVVNADLPAQPALPPGAPPQAAAMLPTYQFGTMLVDDILSSDRARAVMNLSPLPTAAEAKAAVTDGKAAAAIYVPPTFTKDALSGQPTTIQVYTDPAKSIPADIVTQIAQSFTDTVTSGILASRSLSPADVAQALGGLGGGGQQPALQDVPSTARGVKAIQYYAAAMAVMFMVMTAFGNAKEIIESRQNGTLARMLTTPTAKGTILAGQILGSLLVILAQFLVLMIGTRLLFGVYWGNWGAAILLGTAFALAAAGIGTAVSAWINDPRAADAGVGLVGNVFAALSGGMFPLYEFPPAMKSVAHFIPNYWGLQGFLDQMAGLGVGYLWQPVLILALIGIVTGAAGTWRLASR